MISATEVSAKEIGAEERKRRAWERYYRRLGPDTESRLPLMFHPDRVHNEQAQMACVYYCREGHMHFPEFPSPCPEQGAKK